MPHNLQGLSQAEVDQLTTDGHSNELTDKTTRSIWFILRTNLFTYFNMIVIGSCVLLLVLGQWKDALFGFAAIANVFIGVGQEYRAKRLLDKLALIHAVRAHVIRDGKLQEITIRAIVRKDILMLRTGDQVPADAVIVHASGLEVNESLLTGEVDPIAKHVDDKLLSGSVVVAGSAYARTTHVGADSFMSHITLDAKRFSLAHSELRAGIDRVLRWISIAIIPIIIVVVNGQVQAAGGWHELWQDDPILPVAIGAIASIVGMIPLGLVLITSVAFAIGAIKLARYNVLIQELAAVEGLARADIVCFDKTGTLTEGEIVFDRVVALGRMPTTVWSSVLSLFASGTDANATTRALFSQFSNAPSIEPTSIIPFSSSRKWSALSINHGKLKGSWMLGAPEKLIDLADPQYASAAQSIHEMTKTGRRTLLLAYSSSVTAQPSVDSYIPVVVIALKETIRHDVAKTIAYFAQQGVDVRVFSGDNVQTVAAIAREAGIDVRGGGYDARHLPKNLTALSKILDTHTVFGRVDPDQKKDMIRALQQAGHVVAMIGDGVNDTMAVKQADIGVAMGTGSAATRAVSRLVFLDSDFTQFPRVIAEGRQVIANIERLALIFLSKTTYIMALSIISGLLLWGFPFLPRQLSVIDGLTIGIPAFFLALMPGARRYTPGFLGRTLRKAVPVGLVVALVIIGLNVYFRATGPYETSIIQTALLTTLTFMALWILTIFSRPLNRWRTLLVVAMYLGFFGILLIAPIREFFALTIPPVNMFVAVLVASAIGSIIIEILVRYVTARSRTQ